MFILTTKFYLLQGFVDPLFLDMIVFRRIVLKFDILLYQEIKQSTPTLCYLFILFVFSLSSHNSSMNLLLFMLPG